MMGKTHKAGGVLCALAGIQVINSVTPLTSDIHPIIQFMVSYPFCMWGSTAPDLDHAWSNVEDKNPINWGIHRALHVFNEMRDKAEMLGNKKNLKLLKIFSCSHRSWQTHSELTILLLLVIRYLILMGLLGSVSITAVNRDLLVLVLNGIIMGVGAHLFLDSLTVDGLKIVSLTLIKGLIVSIMKGKFTTVKAVTFRLVPKMDLFSTGTEIGEEYEKIVRRVLTVTTYMYTACWLLFNVFNLDILALFGGLINVF